MHWRLGDFRSTLLDLTVRRSDYAMVGVTLTLFGGVLLREVPGGFGAARRRVGIPIIETIDSTVSILDENRELSMHIGPDYVHVVLETGISRPECLIADRVGFFVANMELVGLVFGPLVTAEHDAVLQILSNKHHSIKID